MLLRRGEAHPAALDEARQAALKPGGIVTDAIVPARADRVADLEQRRELALGQRRRALQHRVDDLASGRRRARRFRRRRRARSR